MEILPLLHFFLKRKRFAALPFKEAISSFTKQCCQTLFSIFNEEHIQKWKGVITPFHCEFEADYIHMNFFTHSMSWVPAHKIKVPSMLNCCIWSTNTMASLNQTYDTLHSPVICNILYITESFHFEDWIHIVNYCISLKIKGLCINTYYSNVSRNCVPFKHSGELNQVWVCITFEVGDFCFVRVS